MIADKPTVKSKQLRKEVKNQIDRLVRLQNKIRRSKHFDGIDEKILRCRNDFVNGFRANVGTRIDGQVRVWDSDYFHNKAVNQATHKRESGELANIAHTGVEKDGLYFFTFLYIDSSGRWNLFNFNGIQQRATSEIIFPEDETLGQLRLRLLGYEKDFFGQKSKDRSLGGSNNMLFIKEEAVETGPRGADYRKLLNQFTTVKDNGFDTELSSSAKNKQKGVENVSDKENKLLKKGKNKLSK